MGFLRTFGATLGAGLAEILLDRIAPPGKSPPQQVLDAAPALFGLVKMMRNGAPVDHDVIGGHVIPRDPLPQSSKVGVAWAPGHCSLGEFTCPKCGGHTWSVTGAWVADVVERRCTNGALTAYGPGLDPNTVKEPCAFTWSSVDDAKYFSGVGAKQPEQTIVPHGFCNHAPCEEHVPSEEEWADLVNAIDHRYGRDERIFAAAARLIREADTKGSEKTYSSDDWWTFTDMGGGSIWVKTELRVGDLNDLIAAIGDRPRSWGVMSTAADLIRKADAFIERQSQEIARQAEVIRNYAFDIGGGEIRISEQDTLVLLGGNWTLRHDDGSVVTSVPLGAKEAADHLSTATGVPFSAHPIGTPEGDLMRRYAGEPETRREIRSAIGSADVAEAVREAQTKSEVGQ